MMKDLSALCVHACVVYELCGTEQFHFAVIVAGAVVVDDDMLVSSACIFFAYSCYVHVWRAFFHRCTLIFPILSSFPIFFFKCACILFPASTFFYSCFVVPFLIINKEEVNYLSGSLSLALCTVMVHVLYFASV